MKTVTFGFGGYCANCDDTHDHPLHNIVETIEIPDDEELSTQNRLEAQQALLDRLGITFEEAQLLLGE